MTDPADIRRALLAAGFSPIPTRGKKPAFDEWQKNLETNDAEIQLWSSMWPDATNTGILTKFTPAIDIDIMVADAAAAIEELAREQFAEHGDILVQFGNAPKRAMLLRTDEPFKKIVGLFTAPDGSEHKIEILGDGQQIVVHGIHPDILKAYSWHGGEPWKTPREQLPYAREGDLQTFLDKSTRVLVENFGFQVKRRTKQKANADGASILNGPRERSDWGALFAQILGGQSLHDSIVELAASFTAIGLSEATAIERVRSLMDASNAPKDERWRERYDDIPRAVRTAREKFRKSTPSLVPELGLGGCLIQSSAQFVADFEPPEYVIDNIAQRRYVYSVTGSTGAGKTAILLFISAHAALGRAIGDRGVQRVTVIYFAGENPVDVRMRWIAMAQQMDFDVDTIDVHFIPGVFKISEMMDRIRAEIDLIGDIGLIVVDTSAAYFEGDNENDNVQQGEHARRFRSLTTMSGGPCVLVASHPPKNAGDDNLQPRGGGAFIAEMDGNLTARKLNGAVQLYWQGKFRGPDFAPLTFSLRTVTHEQLKDSEGRLMPTVVASHLSAAAQQEIEKAARSREDQLLELLGRPESRGATQRDLASQLGWFTRDGSPYQMLVSRTIGALKKEKLIVVVRDSIELTSAGKKCVEGNKSVVKKPPTRKRRSRAGKRKPVLGRRTQKVAVSSSDNVSSETAG